MAARLKRAYEPAERSDGYRVLIDRIWPRGVSKEQAHLDEWARELAPSSELRRWFAHDPPSSRGSVMQQVAVVSRRPDLQHQQGDGDGEDCIAERHQPTGVAVH